MGIESDQLVYDYLSRVGDLAQQRQLPSGDRMRLVSSLRDEIDRQRAKYGTETPATVRRVLGRFGAPEEVVERAASGAGPGSGGSYAAPPERAAPDGAVPAQRDRLFPGRGKRVPRPRPRSRAGERAAEAAPSAPSVPAPPHLAGMDELGKQGDEPDWWRVGPTASLGGDFVPGFVGGVEIPEILRPPVDEAELDEADEGDAEGEGDDGLGEDADLVEVVPERRFRPRLRRRRAVEAGFAGPRAGLSNPLLLLAAVLLVAGALFGLWLALAAGWLLAYASRRLSPAESKWAVFGVPGLALVGGLVWLWGRQNGRWGDPIGAGEMGAALSGMWPWVIRVAAVGSAGFVVWRSQRGVR
ncbi:hypothetical protein [Streptomyces sp. NBC_00083]|uniref:hypothetical protein n=1 Tax=Streptomyces sp. NBC_00083 TaxID=2975647 RepID=UPI0022527517|nr:hypothetical protein [Streptomyces sp. NBC_00083]MCX5387911.1 hypothetical protein [Streptomyces sp. NBC_00083]